jgi:hypothetical protein
MDNALKSHIIGTISDTYICEMRNKYDTGYYLKVTMRDLLDHLLGQHEKEPSQY